jgi:hypothetical protein
MKAEITVPEVQGNGGFQVRQFLAEPSGRYDFAGQFRLLNFHPRADRHPRKTCRYQTLSSATARKIVQRPTESIPWLT